MPKAESNLNYSSFFTEKAFFYVSLVFVFGLFFSRAILSISCVLLLLSALSTYFIQPIKINLNPAYILFPLLYLALILSGLYSNDLNQLKIILFKNSIFFIIPIAFLFSKGLSVKQLNQVFFWFVVCNLVCLSFNSIEAITNYHQFLIDISNSKNIQPAIGPDHSELGLLSVITFVLLVYLIAKETVNKNRFILLFLIVVSLIEIHLIAYRFSIISIYLLILIYCLKELFIHKKLKYLIGIAAISIVIFISIITIPSVQKRYTNTVQDLQSITQNKNPNYQSIGQRWAAVKCAFEIIKTHPFLGVSPADASFKIQKQYEKNSYLLIPENRVFIHNQFIYLVLCFGIPFSLIFILLLIFIIYKESWYNHLLIWIIIPFLFHMMIENTLEKQITANAFIFFWLMLFNQTKNKHLLT